MDRNALIRSNIDAIGQRVNTTLPVEVRSLFYGWRDSLKRVDGPFSAPEVHRMVGPAPENPSERMGWSVAPPVRRRPPPDIYFLFSPWPGAMDTYNGHFVPMSDIVSDGFMARVNRVEDDLFHLAREGSVAKVKAVLDAGADVTQPGQGGKPVLIIARESLAETNPARKVFTDEISRLIIDVRERATRNRRAHALATFGPRGSRRARRRRASRRSRN